MENGAFEATMEVGLRKQIPRPVQLLPVICIEHYDLTSKFIGARLRYRSYFAWGLSVMDKNLARSF